MLALLIVSELLPGGASSADPPAAILDYYRQHHAIALVADYVAFVATLPFIAFVAGFASMVRRLSDRAAALGPVLVSAGLVGFGFELAATSIEVALASGGYALTSAGVVAILYWVASRLFYTSVLLLGCFMTAAVVAAWTGLPALLRWAGAAAAGLLVVGSFAIADPHGPLGSLYFVGYGLMGMWMALAAVYALWPGTVAEVEAAA